MSACPVSSDRRASSVLSRSTLPARIARRSTSRSARCRVWSTPARRSRRTCSAADRTKSAASIVQGFEGRLMNIHEYQAKALLHEFGVPISKGVPLLDATMAEVAAKQLPGPVWVVKSQIHAGGRGKGKFKEASAGDKGGVRIAKSVDEVKQYAKQMLGKTLVTVQTGPHGKQVNRLYIEEGSDIDKEFYLSILVNRETSEVSFVVSTEGGVNIEDVAHNTPEKIVTFSVDPATGIMPHHGR